jgi:hypothetical protein
LGENVSDADGVFAQDVCASAHNFAPVRSITDGNPDYLAWIRQETATPKRP